MRDVRPLRGAPAIGRRYDPGFKEPPETKSPWVDEGRPEMGGARNAPHTPNARSAPGNPGRSSISR